MSSEERHIRSRKFWFAASALLAVTVALAAVGYSAIASGDTERIADTDAAEMTHEVGVGHEAIGAVDDHDGDHATASMTHEGDADLGEFVEITLNAVEGRPWRFEPGTIEVPVGHRVKLTLVNDGRAEHDVEIAGVPANVESADGAADHDRLGGGHHDDGVVAAHAEPGTTATVMFTPTAVGEYEFTCTIPGHKEAGMVGKLVVTD
jgi:uncharacterized cupredoxin-like copper-binding protein